MKAYWCFLMLAGAAAASAQTAPADAFRPRPQQQNEFPSRLERFVQRRRLVDVEASLFDRSAASAFRRRRAQSPGLRWSVRLNFFEDTVLNVGFDQAKPTDDGTSTVWSGRVGDEPLSTAVFVSGPAGITGNVSMLGGKMYQVRPEPGGGHTIRELDPRGVPNEKDPLYAPVPAAAPP